MSFLDYLILSMVAIAVLAAIHAMRKNGGCTGDCKNCRKKK